MRHATMAALAACALALGMTAPAPARAQVVLDPPPDSGFYECTPQLEGFVMRYAVGIPPNQTVYVFLCAGSSWVLIDIEYY
jgi:hypothetical protein